MLFLSYAEEDGNVDTVEPVSGVLIGGMIFGERLAASPAGLAVMLGAAVTAVAGIVMLGRSPLAAGGSAQPAPDQNAENLSVDDAVLERRGGPRQTSIRSG